MKNCNKNYGFDKAHIEDYCLDDKTGLYRLSAIFDNYEGKKFVDMSNYEFKVSSNGIIRDLQLLPLPPSKIFFIDNSEVHGDWYLQEELIISRIDDLEVLTKNFMRYIEQITFAEGKFNHGVHSDTPPPEDKIINTYRKFLGIRNKIVPVQIKMDQMEIISVDTEVFKF